VSQNKKRGTRGVQNATGEVGHEHHKENAGRSGIFKQKCTIRSQRGFFHKANVILYRHLVAWSEISGPKSLKPDGAEPQSILNWEPVECIRHHINRAKEPSPPLDPKANGKNNIQFSNLGNGIGFKRNSWVHSQISQQITSFSVRKRHSFHSMDKT